MKYFLINYHNDTFLTRFNINVIFITPKKQEKREAHPMDMVPDKPVMAMRE